MKAHKLYKVYKVASFLTKNFLMLLLLFIKLTVSAACADDPTTYSATFTVSDGTNNLVGAVVSLTGYSTATTASNGSATISGITSSSSVISYTVEMTGYETVTGNVTVNGSNATVSVTLTYIQLTVSASGFASSTDNLAIDEGNSEISLTFTESTSAAALGNTVFTLTPPDGFVFGTSTYPTFEVLNGDEVAVAAFGTENDNSTISSTKISLNILVSGTDETDGFKIKNITLIPSSTHTGLYGEYLTIESSNTNIVFNGGIPGLTDIGTANRVKIDVVDASIGSYASLSLTDTDSNPVGGLLDYDTDYSAEISVWENYNCGFSDEDSDHDKSPTTPRNAVQCIESVNPLHTNA